MTAPIDITTAAGSPVPDPLVARRFLEAHFSGAVDAEGKLLGHILITDRKSKFTYWCPSIDLAVTTSIEIANNGHDADFHLALHDFDRRVEIIKAAGEQNLPKRRHNHLADGRHVSYFRGLLETAIAVSAIWLDIDFGSVGHEKKRLPPDAAAALALIEEIGRRLGFVPTWVVSTGGGFHVYWTFREPLIVDSDAERERFAAVALALTRFAQDVATAVGIATSGHAWEVDSTHDLARVLRVVGTLNCKREPYRSVTFHVERQVRYDITEFESNPALAPFVVDSAAASTRRTRRSSPSPCPRPDAVLLATVSQRIEEMQLGDAGFEAVWSHDESLLWKPTAGQPGRAPDTSMSGWDYRLARWAQLEKWPDAEIFALLWLHNVENRRDPAAKGDSYYTGTIDHSRPKPRAADKAPCEVPNAAPPLSPTRPVVRNADEARAACAECAATWVPGTRSRSIAAFPGAGKTIAAAMHALRALVARAVGWAVGVALLALPTRALVDEKVESLRRLAKQENLAVEVLPLLGRNPNPKSGWYCEVGDRHALRAELLRSGCAGCPLMDQCDTTAGRYRFERAEVIRRIRAAKRGEGPAVLLVTTTAALRWLARDVPANAPIVIDDAGAPFGLVHKVRLRHDDLLAAAGAAAEWRDDQLKQLSQRIGDVIAARKDWIAARGDRERAFESLESRLLGLPSQGDALLLVSAWANGVGLSRFAVPGHVKKHWRADKATSLVASLKRVARRAEAIDSILIADVVERVLHELAKSSDRRSPIPSAKVAAIVAGLPDVVQDAIRDGTARPPWDARHGRTFPWDQVTAEDGEDLRPSFSDLAIRVAKETLEGSPPLVVRAERGARRSGEPDHEIYLGDDRLIERAKKGFVLWLGVAPLAPTVATELNVEQEVIDAQPEGLEVVVPLVKARRYGEFGVFLAFGPGSRRPGKASIADEITRACAVALADRAAKSGVEWQAQRFHRFGAIVHKIDFKALGKPLWAGYYGADHAGTDAFKDCDVLLVRRLVPPYSEIALQAAALRRVLGLPPIDKPGKTTREVRAWPGFAQITCVLEDEFENELLRYHERHSQLNAIGRCRPLSRAPSPTLVVLLAGRPFDGIAPTCKPIGRVLAELGIKIVLPKQIDRDAALEAYNERQAVEVVDRHDRLLGLLRQHGPLSLRRLCTELRVSTSTVRRDLAELQAEGAIGPAAEDRSVTIAIPRSKRDAAELEWPTPERVTGLLTRVGSKVPSANTLRSCLRRVKSIVDRATGPGPVPVPARRSDQAAHLQAVAEAVAQILNAQIDQARAPASDLDLPVALQLFSTTSDSEAWRLLPPIAVRNDRDADVSSVGLFEAGGGQLSEYRRLTDVRLVAATDALRASGLLFFGEATYGELRFSFTVRRTRQGRLALAFPTRHDVRGGKHAIVRPVNDAARVAIEAQVFAAMHLEQDAAP